MIQKLKFPKGFLWGAATSAHQIEGNNINSDWWAWENSVRRHNQLIARGKNPAEYASGLACDSYNRFDEDFDLAKQLGHNATRFSLEWARIEPQEGKFDEKELDHYEKVLQSAKFHGLKTFVTLHHFTNPLWFTKKGAFAKKENIADFVEYARVVTQRFSEYVDFWLTFNEPEIYATYSYFLGVFLPNHHSLIESIRVIKNIITAHNTIAPKIRLEHQKPVSMAYHLADIQPVSWWSEPITAAAHYLANEYILSRTIYTCDFIGVNYYNHMHLGWLGRRKHSQSNHQMSDLGWSIHPEGLERVLLFLKKFNKPVYITENGIADARDTKRERFIKDHLYYAHRAIEKGVDVRGYLYWSLIDNFEWEKGFGPRFGLIEIDYEDLRRRRVRYSAIKYAEICRQNRMEYHKI